PAIALGPLAGVYVDRCSNKIVLILSNLARAFFVSMVTLPWIAHSPKACLALAFLVSIGSQFFGPAETSSIPRLVKKEDLFHANSLFFTTMMIALGFGFAVGEPIISRTGADKAPLAIALAFALAALLLFELPGNKPLNGQHDPWWEELRCGL